MASGRRSYRLDTQIPMASSMSGGILQVMFSGQPQPENPPHFCMLLALLAFGAQWTSFGTPPWMLQPCWHFNVAHASAARSWQVLGSSSSPCLRVHAGPDSHATNCSARQRGVRRAGVSAEPEAPALGSDAGGTSTGAPLDVVRECEEPVEQAARASRE